MPLLITNFDWKQTKDLVTIQVPLKGVSLKNVDIFTSNNYIKIHSPPYLFELCLWHPVVDEKSTCTLANDEAIFQLVKETPEEWPALAAELSREEAIEVKKKAIEEAHKRNEIRKKNVAAKKNERQKAAVREQIRMKTEERQLIDKLKEQERTEALAQMGWGRPHSSSFVKITELPEEKDKKPTNKKIENKNIFKEVEKTKSLAPKPRQTGQIAVSFTPRTFPTPCRESKMAEEQEWLTKQAEVRRKTGFIAEDLRPEEQDPQWIADKAESFYNVGNYLGAISAYSHALTLNNHMYELYMGRAMAHLALQNYNKAILDSSKALELLTPPVSANAEARARCLLCRGSVLVALNMRKEGEGELKAAASLNPNCPDIKAALAQLEV